uniref:Large ribosomal subunit protein uL6c n=1 Tax=Pleurocladia lacustris TaxID=246121 RepID=A0A1I9LVU8_9PHAE|nr:50S ribosomal protein L6 [Pleurocladia lacustris]ANS57574.1 50S ribosomal protein L6 [Pleurocladia lacustris]ANS57718.1 50S ribosomal protein L6 [Pleurocladia lacustris]
MGRIGKLPIKVPSNVQVEINQKIIQVSGPHGKLFRTISDLISIKYSGNKIYLNKNENTRIANQLYGLTRTLINNMVIGVSQKFERTLQLEGVGYRAQIKDKDLILNLGYSHPVLIKIPLGINIKVEKNIVIIITGFDKEIIGQLAATIRNKRPPEPYKGKGILYKGEIIKRKVGKSGK